MEPEKAVMQVLLMADNSVAQQDYLQVEQWVVTLVYSLADGLAVKKVAPKVCAKVGRQDILTAEKMDISKELYTVELEQSVELKVVLSDDKKDRKKVFEMVDQQEPFLVVNLDLLMVYAKVEMWEQQKGLNMAVARDLKLVVKLVELMGVVFVPTTD